MKALRWVAVAVAVVSGLMVFAAAAAASHDTRPTENLRALGHSPNPASFLEDPPGPQPAEINSDLAFWGNHAFHGNYDGFRIIDISDRRNPVELSHTRCQGNQGDIVVWGNILVRSWNSPAPAAAPPFGLATGDGNLMACASHHMANVFDIGDNEFPGGSIDRPRFMYTVEEPGVGDDPAH